MSGPRSVSDAARHAGGGGFGGRRRSRSQEQAQRRRRRRRDGPAEEGRDHLQGPVPVPRREDALVHRDPRPRLAGSASAAAWAATSSASSCSATACRSPRRSRSSPRRPASSSTSGRRREDARKKRLRDVLESAIAFYHAVLTALEASGAAGARLPARPRLHRRDDRDAPARLGARRLGHADPAARVARATSGREELVEVGLAEPRQSGRGGVYDRFRERVIFPIRDAERQRRSGSAGAILASRATTATTARSTSTPRRRRCSTRAGRSTSSTRRRARSARSARRSSSRATPTR